MFKFLQKNPVAILVSRGWHYAGCRRPLMIGYALMFVVALAVTLFEPYIIGRVLNAAQVDMTGTKSGARLWQDVSGSLYLYFFIQLLFWAIHGPARIIERINAFHIKAAYKKDLFSTITALPVQWHRYHHSGESIDKINRASLALGTFFEGGFQAIYMSMRLLGPLLILFFLMPFAGFVALATASLAFLNIYLFDRVLYRHYFQLNKLENRVASAIQDYVTNIGSVIVLRLENRVLQEVVRRMFVPLTLFRRNVVGVELKWFLTTMLISTMITAVLLTYAHNEIAAGRVLLGGSFFTLFEYLRRVGQSFYDFATLYGTIVRQAADVESADTIFDGMQEQSSAAVDLLPPGWRRLCISELNFRYEDEEHRLHHLKDVDLQFEAGQAYAIVGRSGSGKSTLLSLLRGLQQPGNAVVTCDGKLLPDKLKHLSAHTTLIPQDPEIFADTIRFNITFGLDADDKDILNAIKLACFEPVMARLPKGLETNIAEKGVNLSGGEKQRLALARGLFFAKESDMLLLDEPTSSVDAANERTIFTNVLGELSQKCIVASVHRLHLLPLFHKVFLFDDGVIMEEGSFDQLVAAGGRFASLWQNYQATSAMEETTIVVSDAVLKSAGPAWVPCEEGSRPVEQ